MRKVSLIIIFFTTLTLLSCTSDKEIGQEESSTADSLLLSEEQPYLSNLQQLTFGGENAEGYFSFDESRVYLSTDSP